MAPLRRKDRKGNVDEKPEGDSNNTTNTTTNESSVVVGGGSLEEGSDEWWSVLSKKIAGSPRASVLDVYKTSFEMSQKTFNYICSLVKDHMTKSQYSFVNGKPISLTEQVAIALRRLGSGNSLVAVGDSFGTHQSTVSQVTWRFVEAIEMNGMHHIQWPSPEAKGQIKQKFEKIRGLPNCCGAIDTTRIKIQLASSDEDGETWLDCQGNHSMILQVVADPNFRFLDIVTGWPGQMSKSAVLQSSNVFRLCEEGEKLNGSADDIGLREYIVGDTGYPLLPWLVTPYQDTKSSSTKDEFNKRLLATQAVASEALRRWKEVWRMFHGKMWRPDKNKLPRFIYVCCILHNIIIDLDDEALYEANQSVSLDPEYMPEVCKHVEMEGSALRNRLSKLLSG